MFFPICLNKLLVPAVLLTFAYALPAQGVKRVVIVKIDGLPGYYLDQFEKQKDPATGKSILPWIEEVFYKNGTRVPNFYTRGMSLSGPSWGETDTGQHLQIKGNVEYDRLTLHPYDYLNFFPYYIDYGLSKKADMPAVEVMDQLKIPLLSDAFAPDQRYTAQQLYQRGNDWAVLASGFVKLYPGDPNDFIDEWTLGLNFRGMTIDQVERDILGKVVKRDKIDYYDYYGTAFDHVSHHNNDTPSRLAELKAIDRMIGRIWVAIRSSPRANETALVLVSDHGFNSSEKAYSQGFNLVKVLTSVAGGGHHVVTKRRLMLDYSIKGIYPLVPLIRTASSNSYYLQGQSDKYPTALLDFDGNERSSIHLRKSAINVLQILLQQLKSRKLSADLRSAAENAFFDIIDKRRMDWQATVTDLSAELDALGRWVEAERKIIAGRPPKTSTSPRSESEQTRRLTAQVDMAVQAQSDYQQYLKTLSNLLALQRGNFDAGKLKIEDVIAPDAMGEPNSIYELQNYVVGPAGGGLQLKDDKTLDVEKSFVRVNYFTLLHEQKVRNNVQPGVSNRPVDFVAVRVPVEAVASLLAKEAGTLDNPIWLYGGPDSQALILTRTDPDGTKYYRYLPVRNLREDENGKVEFEEARWSEGLPLAYYEDKDLVIPAKDRAEWLGGWHTESEWFEAVHKTKYSNAIIGLNEQVDRHPIFEDNNDGVSADEQLIRRFRQRQRRLTEADLLILANDHWSFDVRGFNPGGNHGSFFRVSTNATFMIAGGENTGINKGIVVDQPYDNLSVAPTILRLMGKVDENNEPTPELRALGFRRFPGRFIKEVARPIGK